MTISASELRNNIYRLLDEVAEEGKTLSIKRKGKLLKVVRVEPSAKLQRLARHDCISGDPEDLVHMDWSGEWNHDLP